MSTLTRILCGFLFVALALAAILWTTQSDLLADSTPSLRVKDGLLFYGNEEVALPIALETDGYDISALVFAVVFDPSRLALDAPSDIRFSLPAGMTGFASWASGRTDTLNVIIFSVGNVTLSSDEILTIPFSPVCGNTDSGYSTTVGFAQNPPISFGAPDGSQIAGTSSEARISIVCRDAPNTSTPTPTLTDIPGITRTPTTTPTPTGEPSGTAGDADGDGVNDAAECPGGIPCPDLDGDGVSDVYESNTDDFDGDGIPDYRDEDDDGDSIPTTAENPDPNGDGNPLDAQNTDGDHRPDYLDVDDDNDGVLTIHEVARSRVGDAGRDTDADGIPDYLDADDDGDNVPSAYEGPAANGSGQDTDGDGTPDYLDSDDDNDRVSTRKEDISRDKNPRNDDTDDDGTPNYLDRDDDNDCISTVREDPNGNRSPLDDDMDEDGIPNYLDTDDDNDGVATAIEGDYDENGDGIPDYLDPGTLGKRRVWLALVAQQDAPPAASPALFPDLVVDAIAVEAERVTVTIRNRGQAAVTSGFWMDVYIDPATPPTGVNQRWNDLGNLGLAWGIGGSALPLAPNAILTLVSGGAHYSPERSALPNPLQAGSRLWAQVDSYDAGSAFGNVEEWDEQTGGDYNNISGPITVP